MTTSEPAGAGTAEMLFPRATLFQIGQFFLHSGQATNWKIEADALTEDDWRGLARIAGDTLDLNTFSEIIGVPRGGTALARALDEISYNKGGSTRRLIVDDVLTTGASILALMDRPDDIGLVVFARGPLPPRVTALFAMPSAITAAESRAMERCAKIADDLATAIVVGPTIEYVPARTYAADACKDIAAAIRSSISPQGTEEAGAALSPPSHRET